MASAPDWVTLTEGEQVVWSGRPSTKRVAEEVVGESLLVVLGVALTVAPIQAYAPVEVPDPGLYPLVLSAVGVLLAAVTYVRFKVVAYVLTTEELYRKEGLVSRSVQTLRLDRVQDHGFEQSAKQRLLGYGDVSVSTAGSSGTDLAFRNVPNPEAVAARISEQLEATRSRNRRSPRATPE